MELVKHHDELKAASLIAILRMNPAAAELEDRFGVVSKIDAGKIYFTDPRNHEVLECPLVEAGIALLPGMSLDYVTVLVNEEEMLQLMATSLLPTEERIKLRNEAVALGL